MLSHTILDCHAVLFNHKILTSTDLCPRCERTVLQLRGAVGKYIYCSDDLRKVSLHHSRFSAKDGSLVSLQPFTPGTVRNMSRVHLCMRVDAASEFTRGHFESSGS